MVVYICHRNESQKIKEVTDITDIVPLKQMLQTYLACILPYTIRAGQDRLMSLSPTSGRCCGGGLEGYEGAFVGAQMRSLL